MSAAAQACGELGTLGEKAPLSHSRHLRNQLLLLCHRSLRTPEMLLKEASPAHAAVRGGHDTPTFTTALQALIVVLFMASLQELVTAHPGDPLQESFLDDFLLPCAGLFMGPLTYRGALTGPPSAALLAASPAPLVALVVMGPGWSRRPFFGCMAVLPAAALQGSDHINQSGPRVPFWAMTAQWAG